MIFDVEKALTMLPVLLAALPVTIQATFGGMTLALVIGLVVAIARMSGIPPLAFAAQSYVEFIRGTPLLVQLFFLFYVLPQFGLTLDAFLTGIIGLGLHSGAYLAEVYRSGIQGVARGQWEASVALNFSSVHTWTRVILPQAVPPVIPVFGNYLVSMFKETALLATITVQELLGAAQAEAARSYRYFEAFTLVGLIFLALSYPSAVLVRRLENRFAARG